MVIFRKIFEIYCRLIFIFYTPLKIIGKKNLPRSSFILCSNHSSHMDTAILGVSTIGFNNLAMMAAKDYWFDNKIRKFIFNIFLNLIPIERRLSYPDKERIGLDKTISYCKNFLNKGKNALLIYPEGTRTRTGKIQPFKEGVALFAAKLNVPIVPIFIHGTFKAWKKGSIFLKPTFITVMIGDALTIEEINNLKKKNRHVFFKAITKEIESRVNQLKEKFYEQNF